jgi:hypothetical protein
VWSNDNGLVSGYVTYAPHSDPDEEDVVAMITVNLTGGIEKTKFDVDISWSDGEIISEMLSRKMNDDSLEDLAIAIDNSISSMRETLFEQMKVLVSTKGVPRYRKE